MVEPASGGVTFSAPRSSSRQMGSFATYDASRPHLLSIAYRMLGSAEDADDIVQEAWMRWRDTDESSVRDPRAWLSVTVCRLCLDKLKSIRRQREAYAGTWLPEPVVTEQPLEREAISLALLVLFETLTPVERAVYILRQVFDYTHPEIAGALDMTEASVRQAFHRAKERVAERRPRFAPSDQEHSKLLQAFGSALVHGDLADLTNLLAADATLWADGGGRVRGAAGRAIRGGEAISRFLLGLRTKFGAPADQTFEVQQINGWPALVGRSEGRVNAILTIETDGKQIVAVRNVVNPEKLRLRTVN
jgi:RNA polymerase sigma-70 factor (ECF subfamily)